MRIRKVVIDRSLYKNLMKLQESIPGTEWAVVGLGYIRDGTVIITDFEVPRGYIDSYSVIFDMQDLLRIFSSYNYVALIHSHHDMNLRISSGDIENLKNMVRLLTMEGRYNFVEKIKYSDLEEILLKGGSKVVLETKPISIEIKGNNLQKVRRSLKKSRLSLYVNMFYVILAGVVFYASNRIYCRIFSRKYIPLKGYLGDIIDYEVNVYVRKINKKYTWKDPKSILRVFHRRLY